MKLRTYDSSKEYAQQPVANRVEPRVRPSGEIPKPPSASPIYKRGQQ